MRLKQPIFLKVIIIYVIFFFCLEMLEANVNVGNVKETVGRGMLAQEDPQITSSKRAKNNTIEQTEGDEDFSKLASTLLTPISDDKKSEMKAELEEMSQNKEFLDELTPERLNQVKKDIENYKSKFKNNKISMCKSSNLDKIKTNYPLQKRRSRGILLLIFPM